jgi:hypothetical protein
MTNDRKTMEARLISGEQQRAAARREHRHQRRDEWQQSRAGHEQAAD